MEEWAKVRQDEVVRLPESFKVHESFLEDISKMDFETSFREIWNMYISIYGDIAKAPQIFGVPLYEIDNYNNFTVQARESRNAPYRPFNLLYNLLISGSFNNGEFIIDINDFKAVNKVKNTNVLFERFNDYGFFFEGLKNYKLSNQNISMFYPDNKNVMPVLKLMADKARITNRLNDFFSCHYKLFQDDMNTANYGVGIDIVADKMHTKKEQEFIYEMDAILREIGYYAQPKIWNEGPGYAYYDKESVMRNNGPYHYLMLSWKTKLILYLRIRNASACLEYLKHCPDTVKQIFLRGDNGCKNKLNGTCKFGQEYTIDGNTYWRCGCCNAPFYFTPIKDDIPHYIKLVELGLKK
ncbi:hypothetical protein SAMN02745176_00945 [Lutispora thermophila DSM 19022]|uniref:Uncharacterized protein n=1 Tax=Lutispora thermophila DSM 19022 TaxID=1122184 RepID=A0A1M6D0S3_9FIRM|nr:hypothetical protein SAMN02745176_00945 [Lutispora thermophila DSM 19022]